MSDRRPGNVENRRSNFKFNAMTNDELRRRREETQVEIRKAKREDSLNKRRNLVENISPLQPQASVTSFNEMEQPADTTKGAGVSFLSQIARAVQMLSSQDVKSQYLSTVEFRKALAKERNAPIQEVVNAGVIPRFVQIIAGQSVTSVPEPGTPESKEFENLVFEAAWVLTNIASGEPHHTLTVVEAGAVPVFIGLMRHHNADIREQCLWALGNIAGDGPALRDYVLKENMMTPLLENIIYSLDSNSISVIRNGTWALSNLCRGSPPPPWESIYVALPVICRLLQLDDTETLVDCCWALAYLTTEPEVIERIVSEGLVPYLVPQLANKTTNVQVPALRAVGSIVTGNATVTQSVIDAGALPLLRALLSHSKVSIVKETCWAISNITAGTPSQIQDVINANIIPTLVKLLSFADYKVKKEACWAICNATSSYELHPDQVKYLVSQGCIKPLCDILSINQDSRVLLVALDGIYNILSVGQYEAINSPDNTNPYALFVEEANGLDYIMELQNYENVEIYEKAKQIIDKFYEGEADDGIMNGNESFQFNPNASVPQGGFNF